MNEQLLPTTSPQILGPFYPLGKPSKGGQQTIVMPMLGSLADMDADAKRVEFNIVLTNG